ncbi:hypothetical protein Tco_1465366 [Tanacetum coccineum]
MHNVTFLKEGYRLVVPGTKKQWGAFSQLGLKRVLEKPNEHLSRRSYIWMWGGRMEHIFKILMDTVLDLEKEKDAQAIEAFDNDLDEKDASKQGRESDKTKSMFQDSDFNVLDDDKEDVEGEMLGIIFELIRQNI